ncbi:methyltransferase domain-containing protein [Lederbergia citri]|uniref:Methyltransferase domain-containing protein n=1 Tax=Lederbergia citri TaxID=2833580 RepID=A0A942YHP0_9BACI|nr:methyltransferase domain-containing protein [Lederbergia citri]
MDSDICNIFSFRQQIEGHPNPSQVICENIIETTLGENQFDIVTIIGSTLEESKQYENVLDKCFNLLKDKGYIMVMDFEKNKSFEDFKKVISQSDHLIIDKEAYDTYESLSFYICKVRK